MGRWDRSTCTEMWEQHPWHIPHVDSNVGSYIWGKGRRDREENMKGHEKRKRKGNKKGETLQWPGRRNSDGCSEWVSSSGGSLQCCKKQQQRWLIRKRMMTLSPCFYLTIIILVIRDGSSFLFLFSACGTLSPGWSMLLGTDIAPPLAAKTLHI